MLVSAEGMYYKAADGRPVLDGTAGLWCVNAGHKQPVIVAAIRDQLDELDFAPTFQMGHPKPFELANRIIDIAPKGFDHVFYTNSGSESVETSLKLAIAYHRLRGEASRTRLIGRERGYHGVNFGGISVGGIPFNRKFYGALLSGVDHLPHTHDLAQNAFSRGQPKKGAESAEWLERIVALHDPSTIAAVIVEPVAGSTGVLIPPVGYLERIREICTRHGILLIFDEVITGFGRLGTPFAADFFGVTPDLITLAKGLTNGTIPMGAVLIPDFIKKEFMKGPEDVIDFFHGYTYSGNPMASAAGIGTLQVYAEEKLFEHAKNLSNYFEKKAHELNGLPHIIDIRNLGMVVGIEMSPHPDGPGKRGLAVLKAAFQAGLLVRTTADIIALSPPLIAERSHVDEIFSILSDVLKNLK